MRKNGTAIRARIRVRKKSADSFREARGEVWMAMTSREAAVRNLSRPPYKEVFDFKVFIVHPFCPLWRAYKSKFQWHIYTF